MELLVQSRKAYAYTGGKRFDASLPCVVFVHGAMHDHSVWGLQSRAFAHRGHSVLAPDLAGHGRSTGPAPKSVEDAAAWLIELIAQAGVQRCALVGHSLGSLIALEAAAQMNERAIHLALLATAFPMKVSPAMLTLADKDAVAAMRMVNGLSHSTLGAKPSSPAPGFWLHGTNLALMRRLQHIHEDDGQGNLFVNDFKICDAYSNGLEAAGAVRCRTTVMRGQFDRMTPPSASNALASVLNANLITLRAGHAMMSEAPDAVLQALCSCLTR